MHGAVMKFMKASPIRGGKRMTAAIALTVTTMMLSGCVVYPSNGYGYAGGYYAAPAVVAPTVVVRGGWGGGWGRGCCWR
jgi:hypothetical protein